MTTMQRLTVCNEKFSQIKGNGRKVQWVLALFIRDNTATLAGTAQAQIGGCAKSPP